MRNIKPKIIIFTILLISPTIYSGAFGTGQQINRGSSNETPLLDRFRGFSIDFNPPKIIQDCGSSFYLNVTLNRSRTFSLFRFLPMIFSVSVFLKVKDEDGKDMTMRIGSLLYVYFPPFQQEIKISVPCLTRNKLLSNLKCLSTGETTPIKFFEGSIGVKIDKIYRWGLDGIIWRIFRTDVDLENAGLPLDGVIWKLIMKAKPDISKRYTVNIIRFSSLMYSFLQRINNIFKNINPLIEWKSVTLISPFSSSDKISIKLEDIDKKTNEAGCFSVTVKVTNNLTENISVIVHVDISDRQIFTTIIPSISKNPRYTVGYFDMELPSNTCIERNISCCFPHQDFLRKDYDVVIECAPYISTDYTNIFGFYFFDIRFERFVKAFMIQNDTVLRSVKKFWYNTPIFSGDPTSPSAIPFQTAKIFYNGPTSLDLILTDIIEKVEDKMPFTIFVIVTILFSFAVFSGFINWIVRKKS